MKRSLSAAVTVAVALAACHADRAVSPGPRAPGGAARAVSLAPTTTKVNFEGLTLASGASVEGLGRVAPNLAIHEITAGGALLVRTGSGPSAYGAPSGESSIANGCLGNPGGWTATRTSVGGSALASFPEDETRSENYDFTFGARAVSRFAIRMVDYGDFNPKLAAKHRVVVTAYDAAGAVVAAQELYFETPGLGRSPAAYQLTGDACTAAPGQPGNVVFTVAGPGITKVTLRTEATSADPATTATGPDPYVAFDDIEFDVEPLAVAIDIKPGGTPNCINNDGNGVIPVAVLGSATFDARTIVPASVVLEGMAVKTVGKASDRLLASYADVNADGYLDLVVQIQDQDGVLGTGSGTATLTGRLTDGTSFAGSDAICIVPPAPGA